MSEADVEVLIADWHRRCRQSQRLHYAAAQSLVLRSRVFSLTAIALTLLVGSSLLPDIQGKGHQPLFPTWLIAALSFAATVVTVLQLILNFDERAGQYRSHSAKYGAVRRELEQLQAHPPSTREMTRALDRVRSRMNELAEESPPISRRIKKREVRALDAIPRRHPAFGRFDRAGQQ